MTIRDVAKRAGVSLSTASLVMNNRPGTTEAMRARVLQAAAEIGFRPNRMAQALRSGRGRHYGVLVPDIANPFYGELVAGIIRASKDLDFHVLVTERGPSEADRVGDVQTMVDSQCAGLVVLDAIDEDREHLSQLVAEGLPVVQVIRYVSGLKADSVRTDEREGGIAAMGHALECGHTSIGIIAGPTISSASRDRLAGYLAALSKARIDPGKVRLVHGDLTRQSGYELTWRMLASGQAPTVIVCGNDLLALGAMDAIMDAGLRTPDDVSVIGYDDMGFASSRLIALTTVRQPLAEMGRAAVGLLMRRTLDAAREPEVCLLPQELIVRESCKVLAASRGGGKPAKA